MLFSPMVTVLTEHGTLPIPPEIWQSLGWEQDVTVELCANADGTLLAKPQKRYSIEETAGILPRPLRSISIEEMHEAISSCSEK